MVEPLYSEDEAQDVCGYGLHESRRTRRKTTYIVRTKQLEKSIPSFDWAKGHSGALLSDEVEAKLDELWEEV